MKTPREGAFFYISSESWHSAYLWVQYGNLSLIPYDYSVYSPLFSVVITIPMEIANPFEPQKNVKLYTTTWVEIATFLGGPLA